MTVPARHRTPSGFSLLELLVVIAIMAVVASAGAMALTGGSKSVRGAASVAASLFNQARTEAILRGSETLVLVDTNYVPSRPDTYVRMAIYSTNEGLLSKWTLVPGRAAVHPDKTTRNLTNITGINNGNKSGQYLFFRYLPNGQASIAGSGGQFVLKPSAGGSNELAGFRVQRMGRVTFFEDPSAIP